jgi:hypothetical protein
MPPFMVEAGPDCNLVFAERKRVPLGAEDKKCYVPADRTRVGNPGVSFANE